MEIQSQSLSMPDLHSLNAVVRQTKANIDRAMGMKLADTQPMTRETSASSMRLCLEHYLDKLVEKQAIHSYNPPSCFFPIKAVPKWDKDRHVWRLCLTNLAGESIIHGHYRALRSARIWSKRNVENMVILDLQFTPMMQMVGIKTVVTRSAVLDALVGDTKH